MTSPSAATFTTAIAVEIVQAEETLTMMLGWEGMLPDSLDPWDTWRVFKRYLRQPVDCARDVAEFRCLEAYGVDGARRYYVSFCRELAVNEGSWPVPIRRVVLEMGFAREAFSGHGPLLVQSANFECLEAFVDHVEGSSHFEAVMAQQPQETDVFAEEL